MEYRMIHTYLGKKKIHFPIEMDLKEDEDRYSRNSENESLKAENCRLKSELYELQRIAGLEEHVEEEQDDNE